MEPNKLRFVRCPRCHQLLVEYPSIPVYRCGSCDTVLRAKHQVVPVAQAGSGPGAHNIFPSSLKVYPQNNKSIFSDEQNDVSVDQPREATSHGSISSVINSINSCEASVQGLPPVQAGSKSEEWNNIPSSLKGSPQNNRLICSDEQKIVSSIDQSCEATAYGIISSTINNANSCEDSNQGQPMSILESVNPVEHQKDETCSLVNGIIQNPGFLAKSFFDKDSPANSCCSLTEKLENLGTSENANGSKVCNADTSEVSLMYEGTDVVQREVRLHMYQGMHVESHEALIEELERSLSFTSDDEGFSDEGENNGLSDALRHQMGSRRFMLGGKMDDASRSDPHGRLIEELEMSFSDAEEPMEQHAVAADMVHGNVHHGNPQTLGARSTHTCEESLSSYENRYLESEQTFHIENRLIDTGNKVKEECHTEDDSTANCFDGNEYIMVAEEGNAERSHEDVKDGLSVDVENAHPREQSVSLFDDGFINDSNNNVKEGCQNAHIVVADDDIAEVSHEIGKDRQLDAERAHSFKGSVSLADDGSNKFEQSFQPNDLSADGQAKEEGFMEDDSMAHYVDGNENLVLSDEDIADRVHGNEELMVDYTGVNEERHLEGDNTANCVDVNENVAVADENIVEIVDKNEHGMDRQSLEGEGAHLDEGILSLFNAGPIKSEQFFQQNELIADNTKEKEDDGMFHMENGNRTNCVQEDNAAVASFSSLSNKMTQCKVPSLNKNKEEMLYRYRASQLRQGLSLDSEDFKSIQNFLESQMDGISRSISSGSPCQGDLVHKTSNKFNNVVRHERLKKMDELRDQLSRLSSQKGLEKRYQKKGIEYQQQYNSYDVEQHFQSVGTDSIPSSCALESYYGHGRPPRYQTHNPLSPAYKYTDCYFGHAQSYVPDNYNSWEFNSYYQSSYAESTTLGHESLMSSYKEKKPVVRKHILRSLSGASPFTICNSCFNLVQMPSDIYISKAKIGKMQCGKCSKVLAISFPAVHNADAKISVDVGLQSYNPDDSIVTKNEDIASYYAECLAGHPVSINEYGASFTRSYSTQAGSSLAAAQSGKKASESALHRLMGYDSASQLLHHSRVFEDGYESFESMVPVSSRVSRRKKT